ncbi:MAG: hypothetical protein ABW170_23300 [Candidatus Thiodiazotropha sp. L084R]
MQLLTGAQIRMARGLLRWSIQDLADHANIGISTVKKLEKVDGVARNVRLPINEAVKDAFLATGKLRFENETCVCAIDNAK